MGRKPTKNLHLPPRMRLKQTSRGKTYYYYDMGGKPRRWKALGGDFVEALRMYADLEQGNRGKLSLITFRHVAERYVREILPTKARETQRTNIIQLSKLYEFFDAPPAPIDEIKPVHIRQYLDWRKASPVAGNREIALLSHIFNKAREWGATDRPNPCSGVRKHRETGRDVYVGDTLYKVVWDQADLPLREAMDLAYLTGQRPADVLKLDERDVRDGVLSIKQNKTGTRLRIQIVGDLAALLDRLTARKIGHNPRSTRLIVDERGQPLGRDALRFRFDRARESAGISKEEFQFRDLRAKAGTDKEAATDLSGAQALLGHGSQAMTEHYVRKRGVKVAPTR
ncbi:MULTISPECIES: tyrosine-type recombinase/integrase [Burkholderia cepacia complex]|uniref:tyrosine-type recombinase/integrase n=1 Tax=Burkholderia cepacia complex TaxID=87882 RepID=UPI00075DB651|nr:MULTISPECIES: tyrosine-type recombinase/integrase [Burkholderia cepacia complex]KVF68928.1 integrase [Burkholderia vietnamiensis]MCA8034058.1 tyrosine-type recombinase/integrase [Burkholderia arboris]